MNIEDLKYVVGAVKKDEPAVIRLFGPIYDYSAKDFIEEFLFIQNACEPSKIVVLINSEGGSVVSGMGIFSTIYNCPIEVDCVIEGIAASMGSVIWAAGDNQYMHDYSLLMIHNPFISCDASDSEASQTIEAFRSQLSTIYRKRFGMTMEQIEKIMCGDEGEDGTFFTAKQAVKEGFLPASNVIKTSKSVRDKVKSQINGVSEMSEIREVMEDVLAYIDENKLVGSVTTIHKQEKPLIQDKMDMENENLMDVVLAQLGCSKDTQMGAVQNRVDSLLKAEATLKEVQDKYTALEIQYSGKEAELANVVSELEDTKAELKKYRDAEEAAIEAEMNAVVEASISAGKIEESAKESWIKMAHADFEMVKSTLASIPAREKITETIARTEDNVSKINETMLDVESQMRKEVERRFGKIEFEKF